MIIIFRSVGN